jgi:glutathione S-transferase
MAIDPPKPIKLYSNKSCPWAQRSRIALLEAGVKYEEVEIDLQNKPEWYTAKINNVNFPINYHLLIPAR